jgi:hypothetical protein
MKGQVRLLGSLFVGAGFGLDSLLQLTGRNGARPRLVELMASALLVWLGLRKHRKDPEAGRLPLRYSESAALMHLPQNAKPNLSIWVPHTSRSEVWDRNQAPPQTQINRTSLRCTYLHHPEYRNRARANISSARARRSGRRVAKIKVQTTASISRASRNGVSSSSETSPP